ncbi:Protein CBG26639 [Caenorhabditis briggsae]|uniref:Protein CBG26639 n=1 Tax=Caenorhabditis briggsae TaxID=6238 RepID=B6IE03_CAEBR|nr:Protein CBG26639 [Caenorhabditis briggsae]CAS01067.1 Protein CBG26639 [Caenorhabditis briggsae]
MAGPSDTNPVNNKTNVEVCQEIANENEATNEAPEDRERWIVCFYGSRDSIHGGTTAWCVIACVASARTSTLPWIVSPGSSEAWLCQ